MNSTAVNGAVKVHKTKQFLCSPQGIAIVVGCTLIGAKYLWNKLHASSANGYNSLIPFTVKQSASPIENGKGHKFATVDYERIPKEARLKRSRDFFTFMNQRRSFRHFSNESVDIEVIRNCIATANTAPSHCSPWTFVVVADQNKRNEIRKVVEAEEQINYDRRMKQTWVDSLKPIMNNLHS